MEKEKCTYVEACPIYRLFKLEAVKDVFVMQYCEGNFIRCERKKRKEAGQDVPEKLLPNGQYLP